MESTTLTRFPDRLHATWIPSGRSSHAPRGSIDRTHLQLRPHTTWAGSSWSGWSRGRVALLGDAAYATSFLSGRGSSVALVGAYLLAGELAAHAGHAEAFAEYERKARPFVEQNQALATAGGVVIAPKTKQDLDARNEALRNPDTLDGEKGRAASTALILPNYDHTV